jgi:hypothetical protein
VLYPLSYEGPRKTPSLARRVRRPSYTRAMIAGIVVAVVLVLVIVAIAWVSRRDSDADRKAQDTYMRGGGSSFGGGGM